MNNLVKYIQDVNARELLWNDGDTLIVGVSGGPDSMCLFDVMKKIAKKRDLTIVVAHVNYGLRGDESSQDQFLVEKCTKETKNKIEISKYDQKESDENSLRIFRYDFFVKMMKKYKTNGILTAHTQNDQAETLLLHLLRGTGLQGLSGMRVKDNNIIRPLLSVNRKTIIQHCKENNISYNIGCSNENNIFTRNKIRNELMPYLAKEFNPNVIKTLAKTTKIVAEDYDFLIQQNKENWQYDRNNNNISFNVQVFLKQHPSQRRIALRQMIEKLQGDVNNIESGFVEELQKVILSRKNKQQVVTGKNLKMLRYGDTVEITCLS